MTLELYWLENCLYYDSRVIIYERKMFYRIDNSINDQGYDRARLDRLKRLQQTEIGKIREEWSKDRRNEITKEKDL